MPGSDKTSPTAHSTSSTAPTPNSTNTDEKWSLTEEEIQLLYPLVEQSLEVATQEARRTQDLLMSATPGSPEFVQAQKRLQTLQDLLSLAEAWRQTQRDVHEFQQWLTQEDRPDIQEEIRATLHELANEERHLFLEILQRLAPAEPEDERPAIIEIRSGTGGDEAALFAGDLFRMYVRYCERKGWKWELLSAHEGKIGGYKHVILKIKQNGTYGILKFESGVHRVQRIPITESGGRIHTSTASVVVLPEPDPLEVQIDEKDIRRETFRASGPGGQHVNKTESAVRLVHIPTGIVVECQDERSQHQNFQKALRLLRLRLYERYRQEREQALRQRRRSAIRTGDRSEKIRTYNFPQNRVTDHRIRLTLYQLEDILDGDLDPLIQALRIHQAIQHLKTQSHDKETLSFHASAPS